MQSTTERPPSIFLGLPDEVWLHALSFLDPRSRIICRLVSKALQRLADDQLYWKHKCLTGTFRLRGPWLGNEPACWKSHFFALENLVPRLSSTDDLKLFQLLRSLGFQNEALNRFPDSNRNCLEHNAPFYAMARRFEQAKAHLPKEDGSTLKHETRCFMALTHILSSYLQGPTAPTSLGEIYKKYRSDFLQYSPLMGSWVHELIKEQCSGIEPIYLPTELRQSKQELEILRGLFMYCLECGGLNLAFTLRCLLRIQPYLVEDDPKLTAYSEYRLGQLVLQKLNELKLQKPNELKALDAIANFFIPDDMEDPTIDDLNKFLRIKLREKLRTFLKQLTEKDLNSNCNENVSFEKKSMQINFLLKTNQYKAALGAWVRLIRWLSHLEDLPKKAESFDFVNLSFGFIPLSSKWLS